LILYIMSFSVSICPTTVVGLLFALPLSCCTQCNKQANADQQT